MHNSITTWITDKYGLTYMETKTEIKFYNNGYTTGNDNTEMLRIAQDGFYVRGVKVEQDEREAESVYKTFHQWLTWATLNRTY